MTASNDISLWILETKLTREKMQELWLIDIYRLATLEQIMKKIELKHFYHNQNAKNFIKLEKPKQVYLDYYQEKYELQWI